ncbi:MAG: hypothetical protein OXP69_12980 [Spirochaetaceae bacterium]|nr:hypothetical protein [Spirochaetaceae bacterium]MDE0447470.1 hypothetical protein [Spirochaetaceae bacterium]
MIKEERMQILSLLEEGKISAAEAARLLDAVREAPVAPARPDGGGSGRLHIQVTDSATGVQRVHLTLPAALAKFAARLAAKEEIAAELADAGISADDLERVQEAIAAGTVGTVLEVADGDRGFRVDIWID